MPPIDLIVGARPNLVKLAPVVDAFRELGQIAFQIVHTGQHYDAAMNDVFFSELRIPPPDVHLEVGSGSHGSQTARILERYEARLLQNRPAAAVVFGDVNSTVACALAAVKLGVPVVHVEAGLRSFDRTMPEEINRLLTDAISDLLLVTEPSGRINLHNEGIPEDRIRVVGNVMIDTLMASLPEARRRRTAASMGLNGKGYGVVTLHRPSNVDDPATLRNLLNLLDELSHELCLVFPMHPRTAAAARAAGLEALIQRGERMKIIEPLPYIDNLSLIAGATVVLTDSGGLQEETTVLGIPCLTLRTTTERPITVDCGTSTLVGDDLHLIRRSFEEAVSGNWKRAEPIPLWDGHAGLRVAAEIASWLQRR